MARRLAENPEVGVLLLEAGGDDDVPSVTESLRWHENLGTERDWGFEGQPNPHLNGRAIPLPMGKVLGGGSSIIIMEEYRALLEGAGFRLNEVIPTAAELRVIEAIPV